MRSAASRSREGSACRGVCCIVGSEGGPSPLTSASETNNAEWEAAERISPATEAGLHSCKAYRPAPATVASGPKVALWMAARDGPGRAAAA